MGDLQAATGVGKYRVLRPLGEGASGKVYEVETSAGARFALKMLQMEGGIPPSGVIARFEREARVCAALESPHIVRVHDFGVHERVPYLVMNLLKGETLEACVERTGPLDPDLVATMAGQVCAGLAIAHERGVIHRDLKPSNLFLEQIGPDEMRVVVCDFGVAKVYDEDGALTASGSVLGTPLYMSPEQLLNSRRVDARCDLWALGMTLYHALTGHAAFEHIRSLPELVLALSKDSVPSTQTLAPWVPAPLARIIHGLLLPLEQRIPTARGLSDLLGRLAPPLGKLAISALAPLPESRRAQHAAPAKLPASYEDLLGEDADAPDPLLGHVLAGRYRVIRQLGVGGMGAVYEGQAFDGTPVALKVMRPELAKHGDGVRRFLREARAGRKIASPFVARLLDEGADQAMGTPFIVMELLRGRDLGALVREQGPLEPSVAAALLAQACRGVAAAHALGIIHRDIKPANLFLHDEGGVLHMKVCDFGIAKDFALGGEAGDASTELTRTGGVLGSPVYMSPEQARNAKLVDARTDVWSLSISAFEIMSGQRPWPDRATMGELILAICTEDVPRLDQVAPWIDSALADVVRKGLAKTPADRWTTAEELASALDVFATREPLTANHLVPIDPARIERRRALSSTDRSLSALSASNSVAATRPRRWGVAAAIGFVVLAASGIGIGAALRAGKTPSAGIAQTSGLPSAIVAEPSTAASTADLPTIAPSSSASAAVSAQSSTTVAARPAAQAAPRASSAQTVSRPPAVSVAEPAPPPPSSSIGRGGTATEVKW